MGSFLDKPKTEKTNEQGHGNDLRYGLAAMQGWRIEMEDSHSAYIGLPRAGLETWSFFAVFDGHAGGTVSKLSSRELIHSILSADTDLFDELAAIYKNHQQQQHIINSNNTSTTTSSSGSNSSNISNDCSSTTVNNSSTTTTNACFPNTNANNSSPTKTSSSTSDPDATKTTTITANHTTSANKPDAEETVKSSNSGESSPKKNSSPSKSSISTTTAAADEEAADVAALKISSSSTRNLKGGKTLGFVPTAFTQAHEDRLKRAIRKGFLDLDERLRSMPEFDKGEDKSGSTAVACLITPSHVYLINCGDSRAILVSGHHVVLGTYDHKPINPPERERIQNAGGSVMIQRVNGSLAVSRALGDYEYKCVEGRGPCEQLVSPEPEIYVHERRPQDEFVVLACDGIWDVMSNDELMDFVHSRCKITNDLVKISNEILDMCLSKGSRDNMSLILVSFPGAPSVDQNEVEKENICNEKIETKVKELIEKSSSRLELSQLLHSLSEEKLDNLPPGGGIHAKHAFIEEIYRRLSPKSNDEENIHSANYLLNPTI